MFDSFFVGRGVELDRLKAVVTANRRRAIVVAGSSGVGKTRLVREAIASSDLGGRTVQDVAATATSSALPLGAIAPLLSGTAPSEDIHALISWAASGLVASAQAGRSPVLLVDDAHLLDAASAMVVYYLARTGQATILATVRVGDGPMPDAVTALWKNGFADRMDLPPIGLDDVTRLLRHVLGGAVDGAWAARVWRLADGSILFLRELILAGLADGSLRQSSGVWRQRGASLPTSQLIDLLGQRIGRLSSDERSVLELLAFGQPLGLSMLIELAGQRPVEQVEQRHLVTVAIDGRRRTVRLAHPLYGETISAGCPQSRRRRLLDLLADAVEANGRRRREDLVRVAVWGLESGTPGDPQALLAACQVAYSVWDLPLAIRLGRAAFEAGGGVAAASLLAIVLGFAGHDDEALSVVESVAREGHSDQETTLLTASHAFVQFWGKDQVDEATARVAAVTSTLGDHVAKLQLAAFQQMLRVHQGRYADVIAEGPASEECKAAAPEAAALRLAALVYAYAPVGAPRRSVDAYNRAYEMFGGLLPSLPHVGRALDLMKCVALILAGQVSQADQFASEQLQAVAEMPGADDLRGGIFATVRALCARLQGRVRDARRLAEGAYASFQGVLGCPAMAAGELAHACALAGDAVAASVALARADRDRRRSMQPVQHWQELARAWVVLSTRGQAAAVETATSTARDFRDQGLASYEAFACHDLVRLGRADLAADRLTELGDLVEGDLVTVFASRARAALAGDPVELGRAADQFRRSGLLLDAAETMVDAADAYRRNGDDRAAARASTAAGTLAARCQGARTPALGGVRTPDLTRREREIAGLAATGLISRVIGDRLGLSARTVDNHLRSVYRKLGVDRRDDLHDALGAESAPAHAGELGDA